MKIDQALPYWRTWNLCARIEWFVFDVYAATGSFAGCCCGEHILLSKSFNTDCESFFMFLLIRKKKTALWWTLLCADFILSSSLSSLSGCVRCLRVVFICFDERVRVNGIAIRNDFGYLGNVVTLKAFSKHLRGHWLIFLHAFCFTTFHIFFTFYTNLRNLYTYSQCIDILMKGEEMEAKDIPLAGWIKIVLSKIVENYIEKRLRKSYKKYSKKITTPNWINWFKIRNLFKNVKNYCQK